MVQSRSIGAVIYWTTVDDTQPSQFKTFKPFNRCAPFKSFDEGRSGGAKGSMSWRRSRFNVQKFKVGFG